MSDTTPALPLTCVRCGGLAMLRVAGRCADCIADMGLRHPLEYARWMADVRALYNSRS